MSEPTLDGLPLLEAPPRHAMALAGPTQEPGSPTGLPDPEGQGTAAHPFATAPTVAVSAPSNPWVGTDPEQWLPGAPHASAAASTSAWPVVTAPVHSRWTVDWSVVRTIRQKAAQRLAERLHTAHGDEEARRRQGREIVTDLVADHARSLAAGGLPMLGPEDEDRLVAAVMDALFGLGRLQPLIDDDAIENIEITGFDQVRLLMRDGAIVRGEPVADSDEELIEFLQFIASRGSASGAERPFSQSNPRLHLSLPGRGRLAATAWVTARPVIRIRRQTIREVTLADLRELGSIGEPLQRLLESAMASRLNIVVSGEPGVGKTTFVRALAAAIPAVESLATLESEWELYLDRLPSRTLRPVEAFEARPGAGEFGPDGRRTGSITLEELFEDVLRHNVDRIIVGEVRGSEALAMFRAMQAGRGSLSTIHAKNARDTAQRLVTCLSGSGAAADYAWGLVATNIDLVIHLRARIDSISGRRHRYVAEVVEVHPGEGAASGMRPSFSTLFAAPRGSVLAEPVTPPTPALLEELMDAGFDPSCLGVGPGSAPPIGTSVRGGGW